MSDGGFSTTRGWVDIVGIFGYKLHMISSSTGSIAVPLSDDVTTTTANVPDDNQVYHKLISKAHP